MEQNIRSNMDFLVKSQASYSEAKEKLEKEATRFAKTKNFTMSQDGKYTVRILPNVPVIVNGEMQPLDRKSYEYPVRRLFITLKNPNATERQKDKVSIAVINAKDAKYTVDIIDKYVEIAKQKYAGDKSIIDKVTGNSFNGGLKWNSIHSMYVYDMGKMSDGIQLLSLSYSQYKDLEDSKMMVWEKRLKKNPEAQCPISSPLEAYPVIITRSNENGKTSYKFTIDVMEDVVPISENQVNELFKTPRIPEVIYKYTRWHFEATVMFLKQYDATLQIDVMSTNEMQEAIEQLKLSLPADDTSHFSFDKKENNNPETTEESGNITIDYLWDEYDNLVAANKDDKSEEGQNLRDMIRQYIDDNKIDIRVSRIKTNKMLLEDIEEFEKNATEDEQEETPMPIPAPGQSEDKHEPEEEADEQPEAMPEPEEEERVDHSLRRRRANAPR